MVGNRPAEATLASDRARLRRSCAAASDWLAASNCCSYWLSWSSWKTSHHAPLGMESLGAAARHGPSLDHASGAGATGRWYLGPTVHPAKITLTMTATMAAGRF